MGGIFAVVCAFFLADFLFCQKTTPVRVGADTSGPSSIAFFHALHGDSIGLACTACHTGAASAARAYMPAKADCMDCHRLPLTENPGIDPWEHEPELPEHVVFHHGVHAAAGVECADCHRSFAGGSSQKADVYGGDIFSMQMCIACHRGDTFKQKNFKRAATYCAACHR